MSSYNKCILMGNLTRDVELRMTPSQTSVASFSIAQNRKYKAKDGEQREEVSFFDCQAWGRTAEVINQYFTKGKPIFLECRAKQETWEDKNGGGKRSKVIFVVEKFEFIGGRDGEAPVREGGDSERQFSEEEIGF